MSDWLFKMPPYLRLTIRNSTRAEAVDKAKNWASFLGYSGPLEPKLIEEPGDSERSTT